jgi:hypothetical protein
MSARDVKFEPSTLEPGDRLDPIATAQEVAIARGQLVAEAFFHIAAIRSLPNAPPKDADVACVKAELQDTTAQYDQQAAHLLPGSIVVHLRPVWEWADPAAPGVAPAVARDVLRLEQQMMWCFAKTTVLPAIFNRADSQAEGRASSTDTLKPLFGQTVRQLWSGARATAPLTVDYDAVVAALRTWFGHVNVVYQHAATRKDEAARRASGDPARQRERAQEALVLRTYANSFAVANVGRFVETHARAMRERYALV